MDEAPTKVDLTYRVKGSGIPSSELNCTSMKFQQASHYSTDPLNVRLG